MLISFQSFDFLLGSNSNLRILWTFMPIKHQMCCRDLCFIPHNLSCFRSKNSINSTQVYSENGFLRIKYSIFVIFLHSIEKRLWSMTCLQSKTCRLHVLMNFRSKYYRLQAKLFRSLSLWVEIHWIHYLRNTKILQRKNKHWNWMNLSFSMAPFIANMFIV